MDCLVKIQNTVTWDLTKECRLSKITQSIYSYIVKKQKRKCSLWNEISLLLTLLILEKGRFLFGFPENSLASLWVQSTLLDPETQDKGESFPHGFSKTLLEKLWSSTQWSQLYVHLDFKGYSRPIYTVICQLAFSFQLSQFFWCFHQYPVSYISI